ncbi:MAG: hypothetical protein LZF62_480246 [Nitrospira sp.]|nr:MAG: hypothetical protein LZF62_480246 [Nitrospira sp.]
MIHTPMSLLIISLPTALLIECKLRGGCNVNCQKVLLMACLTLEEAHGDRGVLAQFVIPKWAVPWEEVSVAEPCSLGRNTSCSFIR